MSEDGLSTGQVAGLEPLRRERPSTLAELRSLVTSEAPGTLVPVGAGTQLELGGPPTAPFSLVELGDALAGEAQHEPTDLTLDVPAVMSLGQIQALLAAHRQFLPIDPPLAPRATIGGTLAAGPGGPLRTRFGLPRDFVLGMTVLRADGELVRAGGRVVKNVAGYDLVRLWCGSLGTLGIITRVALRVLPRPETVDLVTRVPSLEEASRLADRVAMADIRPLVFDAVSGLPTASDWQILARVDASAEARTRQILAGSDASPSALAYEACRDLGFTEGEPLVLRVATVPTDLDRCVNTLRPLGPSSIVARPLAGFARAGWRPGATPGTARLAHAIASLRESLAPNGGSLVIERMPGRARQEIDTWGDPGPAFPLMQRVKQAYDPYGRFNRGRFAGGI